MCSHFTPIRTTNALLLIIHHRELARTTNTGTLAQHTLVNSKLCIRGLENQPLDVTEHIKTDHQQLLLYPSDDAIVLSKEYLNQFNKPIQLIVPDGNWRQASKVHTRQTELKNVPRVTLPTLESDDQKLLRKESKPNGMATLQAIAYAFGIIENTQTQDALLDIYQEKLSRTLKARGIKV